MDFKFSGKNAVIIGRSDIVGKPMAKLLLEENMNTTILHSKTSEEDKKFYLKNADLVIVATGQLNTLNNSYVFKDTSIVIDVGINVDHLGKLCGDCQKDLKVAFQSPVPGGVGLLTRLALIENALTLKML
jgi:methylenetetrahydrofolate dehydrogenase (NADP+)/methenyltetrahydrofolate cyclohydrolase